MRPIYSKSNFREEKGRSPETDHHQGRSIFMLCNVSYSSQGHQTGVDQPGEGRQSLFNSLPRLPPGSWPSWPLFFLCRVRKEFEELCGTYLPAIIEIIIKLDGQMTNDKCTTCCTLVNNECLVYNTTSLLKMFRQNWRQLTGVCM